jgi:hypothetical protein
MSVKNQETRFFANVGTDTNDIQLPDEIMPAPVKNITIHPLLSTCVLHKYISCFFG